MEINEEVDKLAKAYPEPWNIIPWISLEDLLAYFKKQHKSNNEEAWKKGRRHKKYNYISHLEKWNRQAAKNRNTEVLINKLRAKKLPLKDIYVLFKQTDSPSCSDSQVPEISELFILNCNKYKSQRKILKHFTSNHKERSYSSIANCKTIERVEKVEEF
ncbi:hypothetical protein TNCV_736821 [Trichonephila clavipes]|nr:hypothetical protein TNCV_736821 [Trichonephila clavipes]